MFGIPAKTDFSSNTGSGFFRLFKYISLNNNTQGKISITAPVIMQESECDSDIKRRMSFIMSSSRFQSSDKISTASDKNIEIIEQDNLFNIGSITFNMSMIRERNAIK
ncbi:unnamed protein product [Rotaria sordida]|uniref:Uncharacterized protein n=2 Tax=Rotaria sordida TaxID=392033 RepID=A0A820ALV1_9BILA|nr:unnamed protein product [Rotaria sordida]